MSEPDNNAPEIAPGDEIMEAPGTRVTLGAGRKISDGNYGSYDFHCSMTTDVKVGESPIDAAKRCIAFNERVIATKVASAAKKKLSY